MIIPSNLISENDFSKIFNIIKKQYKVLNSNENKNGRPKKFTDQQIIACAIYGVHYSIFSLRELEYKINRDLVFKEIIGITNAPDYSTFSIRLKKIEQHIYYGIYAILIECINPKTRLCAIDATALRSSRFDSEAKKGKGTRLGFFTGYKLHCMVAVTDIIIPLVFDITTANVYDNQPSSLLYETKIYNPFLILGDAAYDSEEWFKICEKLDMNLLTDINMRKAKSIESFNGQRYKNALFRKSPIGKKLYKSRLKIEQLFSVLKGLYNLENPRLYGINRYKRHVKWCLMAYLIDEYRKKSLKIVSRKYPWNL
ncbi:transposase [Cetobacterium sp.]|uniref:transposase n=1 Tax=Cetobacterium sp. TaxID=2071632 RepID=UPI003EE432DF